MTTRYVKNTTATHEITFTVTWRPTLTVKTVDKEVAEVRAHIINFLLDEECEISDYRYKTLPKGR